MLHLGALIGLLYLVRDVCLGKTLTNVEEPLPSDSISLLWLKSASTQELALNHPIETTLNLKLSTQILLTVNSMASRHIYARSCSPGHMHCHTCVVPAL